MDASLSPLKSDAIVPGSGHRIAPRRPLTSPAWPLGLRSNPPAFGPYFGGKVECNEFEGFFDCPSFCWIETIAGPRHTIVIFTDDPRSPGTCVSLMVEQIAT
jgi:hypothetical protein